MDLNSSPLKTRYRFQPVKASHADTQRSFFNALILIIFWSQLST